MITTTFTAGQTYKVKGSSITITRRTEKSVWFLGWDGKEVRRKPETVSMLGERFEVIRYDDLSIVRACDVRACDVVAATIEVNETVESSAKTMTTTERRAMIDRYKSLSFLLINTDEDSPKWDAIWSDMQSLKSEIDAAIVVD